MKSHEILNIFKVSDFENTSTLKFWRSVSSEFSVEIFRAVFRNHFHSTPSIFAPSDLISMEMAEDSKEVEEGEICDSNSDVDEPIFNRNAIETEAVADEIAGLAGVQAYSSSRLERGLFEQVNSCRIYI